MQCLFSWYIRTVSNMRHHYFYNSHMVTICAPGYEYICVEGFRICFNVDLDSSWFCPLIFRLCNRYCSNVYEYVASDRMLCVGRRLVMCVNLASKVDAPKVLQCLSMVAEWTVRIFLYILKIVICDWLTCDVNKLLENQPSDLPCLSIPLQM